MTDLKITLKRSVIGRPQNQREIVKAFGLHRISSSVIRPNDAVTRGVIAKISHLVDVEEVR